MSPPAAAGPEICPLRNAETEHHCVEVWEDPFTGERWVCVMSWNVQHTSGEGRCVGGASNMQ